MNECLELSSSIWRYGLPHFGNYCSNSSSWDHSAIAYCCSYWCPSYCSSSPIACSKEYSRLYCLSQCQFWPTTDPTLPPMNRKSITPIVMGIPFSWPIAVWTGSVKPVFLSLIRIDTISIAFIFNPSQTHHHPNPHLRSTHISITSPTDPSQSKPSSRPNPSSSLPKHLLSLQNPETQSKPPPHLQNLSFDILELITILCLLQKPIIQETHLSFLHLFLGLLV